MAEPILKWAGGKRQLLDELYARFPATYGRYHEPFVGGGAVFFDLEPTDATVNDANPRLVNFYERVRDEPEALIERLESFDDPDADPGPALPYAEGPPAIATWRATTTSSVRGSTGARTRANSIHWRRPHSCCTSIEPATTGSTARTPTAGSTFPWAGTRTPTGSSVTGSGERASDALTDATIRNDDFAYVLDAAGAGRSGLFRSPTSR